MRRWHTGRASGGSDGEAAGRRGRPEVVAVPRPGARPGSGGPATTGSAEGCSASLMRSPRRSIMVRYVVVSQFARCNDIPASRCSSRLGRYEFQYETLLSVMVRAVNLSFSGEIRVQADVVRLLLKRGCFRAQVLHRV